MADYAAWLKGLGAAGGNWARLWLAYNEKGLEWMPRAHSQAGHRDDYLGLGRYSPGNAWRLDEVVRLARENGVYLMFCLGTYGEFTEGGYFNEGCWVSNPYNAKNGGPCARPADFWTNPEARRLYKKRLRYLIARWGYSPNVFAWEFWNEVPATPANAAWVAEMAAYLKRHDPNQHLVSTTYGNAATWKCPDVDFTMTHMYGQAGNTADFTHQIAARRPRGVALQQALPAGRVRHRLADRRRALGPPAERPEHAQRRLGRDDDRRGRDGDALVLGRLRPSVATFITCSRPCANSPTRSTGRRRASEPISGLRVEQGRDQAETFTDLLIPATVEWGRSPSSTYTVGHDGTVQGGPVAMTIGSPSRGQPEGAALPADLAPRHARAGKIVARLGQVCSEARLQITVDGQVKLDRTLTAGEPGKGPWKKAHHLDQWNVWVSDYDEEIAIDVPAGRHDVTFANTEGDWLQIRSLRLPHYRSSRYPAVDALGLASDRLLLLWFHNQESTWRTEYDGKKPASSRAFTPAFPRRAARGRWSGGTRAPARSSAATRPRPKTASCS